VHYAGGPSTLVKGEIGADDYAGDSCSAPGNIETITNYYGVMDRHKEHPAKINEDNGCPWYYAHIDFEPDAI